MKVKQIQIKHPSLGEIVVNSGIEKDIAEQIGDICSDYSNEPLYYCANISKNEDETFSLKNLHVIRPEGIHIGWMKNSKGEKNFITVVTNKKAADDITVYPSAVLSVIYEEQKD